MLTRRVLGFCVACAAQKIADAKLIAKWKKPGYERLCSTYAINPKNFNFGGVSLCRVPRFELEPGRKVQDPFSGCRGCASGPAGYSNIFGNKYGQNIASIQIAREERLKRRGSTDDSDSDSDGEGKEAPAGAGGGVRTKFGQKLERSIWADNSDDAKLAEGSDATQIPGSAPATAAGGAGPEKRGIAGPAGNPDDGAPSAKRSRVEPS